MAWVERQWWTLQRFGLTPAKLPRHVLNRHEPQIFCNSLPKAGTHLLERALCLHPHLYRTLVPTVHEVNVYERGGMPRLMDRLRPGEILVAHLQCRAEWAQAVHASGARSLIMVRDPRDIAISFAHYIAGNDEHPWHARFVAEPDLAARIRLSITGDGDQVSSLAVLLGGYIDWREAGALVVRFEDLVGPDGGGSAARQMDCLGRIYDHLGLPVGDELLARVRAGLFSSRSPTFRQGTSGQWRSAFDDETRALFDSAAGELLAALGYAAS